MSLSCLFHGVVSSHRAQGPFSSLVVALGTSRPCASQKLSVALREAAASGGSPALGRACLLSPAARASTPSRSSGDARQRRQESHLPPGGWKLHHFLAHKCQLGLFPCGVCTPVGFGKGHPAGKFLSINVWSGTCWGLLALVHSSQTCLHSGGNKLWALRNQGTYCLLPEARPLCPSLDLL